jgi:integrase
MSNSRKRRGRGEGGIRFREDKGLWVAEVRNGTGRRRTVYGKTKKEVQESLKKLHLEAGSGLTAEASGITVGQWFERWCEMLKPKVAPNTHNYYERMARLHITPNIGGLKLAKLSKPQVHGLYAALAKAGASAAMQSKIGTVLTMALKSAVKNDLLASNPAAVVDKPRHQKPEMKPLDPEQAAAFLQAAKLDRLFAFYRTALDTGARPGELFALQWPDVDLEGAYITVNKSLEEIAGVHRIKAPKTAKSRRRIDLSGETVAVLAEHRKAMLAEGHIGGPVFCDKDGGYLRISNLRRDSFLPILKRAGLPAIRLYDLRHTCATLLLLADVSPKIVSERLGHSTITLTLDTYSHVLPTMQRKAADAIGRLLGGKPENGGTMAVQGG